MRTLRICCAILMIATQVIYSQEREELEDFFSEGHYFFARGDYEDAAFYFIKLVNADPENAHFNFLAGESYLNIPGKEQMAIPYFERSLDNVVAKKAYRQKVFEEKAAPLHAYFYLGNAYRMNSQLDKALESYKKFIDSPFYYGNYNQNIVDREMKSCERAKIIQDAPIDLEITNMGGQINTEFAEERPVLSGDGNTLVFVRRLQFYDAIFFVRKIDGVWSKAVNINPQIISDGQFYPSGLSFDGSKLLLIKDEKENADIYISEYNGNTWSKAFSIPGKLNSLAQETHASFHPEGELIYLSSNRNGSVGGYDIFISKLNDDGLWGKPKNAGKTINTEFDEQVAYFTTDANVLFFSSNGHYNMGGYDIFFTRNVEENWLIPVNIGYPVNTTRDNMFYQPDIKDRRTGYLSIEQDEGYGQSDIYMIRILSDSILNFDP